MKSIKGITMVSIILLLPIIVSLLDRKQTPRHQDIFTTRGSVYVKEIPQITITELELEFQKTVLMVKCTKERIRELKEQGKL
jgi:hypothetical protein